MKTLQQLIKSKKFLAMVGAILVMLAQQQLGIDEDTAQKIMNVVIGYIIGQGIADNGKEAARIKEKDGGE